MICGAQNELLIDTSALSEEFQSLVGIYIEDENGKPLVDWLREDWALFPASKMDRTHANELLAELLDNGEIVRRKFSPMELDTLDLLDRWNRLRSELMHQNRFFPQTEFDANRLSELLDNLIMDKEDVNTLWYRARIEREGHAYPPAQMGAPPEAVALHGRVNPAGIPYLYLGSTPETAVAEVRPYPGDVTCVAEFTIANTLRVIDLREPKKTVSPFLVADESTLPLLRGDLQFLERLGEELKTPVLPTTAAIAYIPSQYLCEFIKKCGHDGVVFGSSVSAGMNLALFYPDKAGVGKIEEYDVNKVAVEIARRNPNKT